MKSQRVYTISMRLWILGFGAVATILAIGMISYWSTNSLRNHMRDMVEDQLPAVKNMGLTDMMHDGIRGNAMSAIVASINKDEKELANLKKESEDFAKQIAEYISNLEKLPLEKDAKESIAKSKVYIETYLKSSSDILAASLVGDTKKAVDLVPNLQKEFEHLEESLGKLGDLISAQAVAHGDDAIKDAKFSTNLSIGITSAGFLLGLMTCFFAIRSINSELAKVIKNLGEESENVAHTAEKLNKSATELATETTQQASALQETASSMDEIAAMVKLTSDNSVELERSAKQSLESAATGQTAIQQMLTSITTISSTNDKVMSQVEDNTRQISGIMQMMGEISTKTKVINDIVFQTKLLSFNASVEAARAGEHGKGFAVVAEEVGNLARMSGNAAKEITDLLDSSVRKVEEIVSQSKRKVDAIVGEAKSTISTGVSVAKQCDTALQSIVKQSTQVNELITAITQAIREQDQGVVEVSKALRILDQSTNQNATTAKETRTSADALLVQSEGMERIVGKLESLSGLSAASSDASTNQSYKDHEAHRATKNDVDKAFGVVKQFRAQEEIQVQLDDEIKKAS